MLGCYVVDFYAVLSGKDSFSKQPERFHTFVRKSEQHTLETVVKC